MHYRDSDATTVPVISWVLIVDDERDVRNVLRRTLEEEGYGVLEATNGVEALATLRASARPLVTVLDNTMPELSGSDVLIVVATEPQLAARHAFILATARQASIPQRVVTFARQHGIPLVPKPFDLDRLLLLTAGLAARLRLDTRRTARADAVAPGERLR
jgi:CheY-like chemotaxis protein